MSDVKTLIAIPAMDMVATPFMYSLVCMQRVGLSRVSVVSNSLVYMARNMLAAEAIDSGCDRVLWLDSDMCFAPNLMKLLSEDMDSGRDYVCGLFFKRRIPTKPLIYHLVNGKPETYTCYPPDCIFPVDRSGFGAVMTSTKLLRDVYENCGPPFNPGIDGTGEDMMFCDRAKSLGYELFCDSRIKVQHIGSFPIGEEQFKR